MEILPCSEIQHGVGESNCAQKIAGNDASIDACKKQDDLVKSHPGNKDGCEPLPVARRECNGNLSQADCICLQPGEVLMNGCVQAQVDTQVEVDCEDVAHDGIVKEGDNIQQLRSCCHGGHNALRTFDIQDVELSSLKMDIDFGAGCAGNKIEKVVNVEECKQLQDCLHENGLTLDVGVLGAENKDVDQVCESDVVEEVREEEQDCVGKKDEDAITVEDVHKMNMVPQEGDGQELLDGTYVHVKELRYQSGQNICNQNGVNDSKSGMCNGDERSAEVDFHSQGHGPEIFDTMPMVLDDPADKSGMLDLCSESLPVEAPSSICNEDSSSPSAEKMESDEPVALWVKWRGKWQAGIRCSGADCPLSTLKAKPTNRRKEYIVVFFPQTCLHCWVDGSIVRPINQEPEPLANGTHLSGRELVKDLNIPKHHIMQKLALAMLDISDKLHLRAVIESGQKVSLWKEFATEASRCVCYSDLGNMLLKLQSVIVSTYISSDWRQHSFLSWADQSRNAKTAQCIEILVKELMEAVLWHDIDNLWDEPTQPDLCAEWKNWKQEVRHCFYALHPISGIRNMEKRGSSDTNEANLHLSRKRLKHDTCHPVNVSPVGSDNCHLFNEETSDMSLMVKENGLGKVNELLEYTKEAGVRFVDVELTADNESLGEQMAIVPGEPTSEKRYQRCLAFIEAKHRQCGRWASDGEAYCIMHLNSVTPDNIAKAKQILHPDSPICEGTTTSGRRCKHRSRDGTAYCLKHRLSTTHETTSSVSIMDNQDKKHCRKPESQGSYSEDRSGREATPVQEYKKPNKRNSNFDMEMDNTCERDKTSDNSAPSTSRSHEQDYQRCYGWSHKNGSQCSRETKANSLFCKKHIPTWIADESQLVSSEIFDKILNSMRTSSEKANVHRASELLYTFMKENTIDGTGASKEETMEPILSNISNDVHLAQCLLQLVSFEKDKLDRTWNFQERSDKAHILALCAERQILPAQNGNSQVLLGENNRRCKFCPEIFSENNALGSHWMASHKKEAQWLFRGYACGECKISFTNKKVLVTHVKETHIGQPVEQSILYLCMMCNSHFASYEKFWLHVVASHHADLGIPVIQQSNNSSKPTMPENGKLELRMENVKAHDSKSRIEGGNYYITGNCIKRFTCRFCGLNFNLLPELGRHHQAAHMGSSSIPSLTLKRINHLDAPISLGKNSHRKLKKRLREAVHVKDGSPDVEGPRVSASLGQAETYSALFVNEQSLSSYHSDVSNSLFPDIQEIKPRPSNNEILTVARTACCKTYLRSRLEENYGTLPDKIYVRAAKLCSEANIEIEWHQENHVCSKGCEPIEFENSALTYLPEPVLPMLRSLPQVSGADAELIDGNMDESHCVLEPEHFKMKPSHQDILICNDLSFGKEQVPVPCKVDVDVAITNIPEECQLWKGFTYITERLLDPSLGLEFKSSQLGCGCSNPTCYPEMCDHVYLFNNDYEDAVDVYGKSMEGRFPYDEYGRIVLKEEFLVYECNTLCHCSKTCQNRILQRGMHVKVEVYKTEKKGWAVRAGEPIPRGTFVCEYIGEVLSDLEMSKRGERCSPDGCCYLFYINVPTEGNTLNEGAVRYFIDATKYGNVSRFINHSCSPNLVNYQVLVESMDCQLAHIGLFACRDIALGEELAFDYSYKLQVGEGCPCYCGAANCRGRID